MANQGIQMPLFGKAGNTSSAQSDWGDGDNFDVEMLAEYLLDDATAANVTFDFKLDSGLSGSGVVSPETSEDGALPTVAEQSNASKLVPAPAQTTSAPVAAVPAPTPTAPGPNVAAQPSNLQAPAPSVAAMNPTGLQPQMAHPGALASLAPAAQMGFNPFSALSAVMMPSMQQSLLFQQQQHQQTQQQAALAAANANAAKRRRVDQSTVPTPLPMPHPGMPPAQTPQGLPIFAMTGMNPAALFSGQQLAAAAAQAMQQQNGMMGPGRKKKTQAQIDRRRERNRILARRTRLRKKFFFESLQKEVMDLQQENVKLKELVRLNLKAENSKAVLDECDAMEKMPPSVLEAIGESAADIDPKDFSLVRSIQNSQYAFVISDPSLQDNPIVFASDDFCTLTGYKREEVLGRNCRFLQGEETSKEKANQVEEAIKNGEDVSVTFINYKADGTPFWNKLFIASLRDAQNAIVNFIAVVVQVANPPPEDPEHGKSLPVDPDADDDDEDCDISESNEDNQEEKDNQN